LTFNISLLLLSVPYLGFTSYDLWMHKHDRHVPQIEKILHAITVPCILTFLYFSIFDLTSANSTTIASIALLITLPCMIADEVIYHKHLHKKEKTVHRLAGVSLITYIAYWLWMI